MGRAQPLADLPDGVAISAAPASDPSPISKGGIAMQWIDPAFCDIRLGFEVTAYVYVR